jgi:hypothetical protein
LDRKSRLRRDPLTESQKLHTDDKLLSFLNQL